MRPFKNYTFVLIHMGLLPINPQALYPKMNYQKGSSEDMPILLNPVKNPVKNPVFLINRSYTILSDTYTYTFAAYLHIECISGVLKINFSTFYDPFLGSYHYSYLDEIAHVALLGF